MSQAEPCVDCESKYKCDAERLACAEFKFFVNTSYASKTGDFNPTRAIYIEIFYKDPDMLTKKVRIKDKVV